MYGFCTFRYYSILYISNMKISCYLNRLTIFTVGKKVTRLEVILKVQSLILSDSYWIRPFSASNVGGGLMYTANLKRHHNKNSRGERSGDLGGQHVDMSSLLTSDRLARCGGEARNVVTLQGAYRLIQCFSTFVRPRPGKFFFFRKTRVPSQQIYP